MTILSAVVALASTFLLFSLHFHNCYSEVRNLIHQSLITTPYYSTSHSFLYFLELLNIPSPAHCLWPLLANLLVYLQITALPAPCIFIISVSPLVASALWTPTLGAAQLSVLSIWGKISHFCPSAPRETQLWFRRTSRNPVQPAVLSLLSQSCGYLTCSSCSCSFFPHLYPISGQMALPPINSPLPG